MKKISSVRSLRNAIAELEQKRIDQEMNLKQNWEEVAESLRPANIIRRSVRDILPSANTRSGLMASIIGLGTVFLSKKLILGKSAGPVKKILGTAVEWGISSLILQNAARIKEAGRSVFGKLFRKKHEREPVI
jgi:hypothetical protein